MNSLREWIASTIPADVNAVLDVIESPSTSGEFEGITPVYHDDGSNLRIQPSKKGVVQITKVSRNSSEPFCTLMFSLDPIC